MNPEEDRDIRTIALTNDVSISNPLSLYSFPFGQVLFLYPDMTTGLMGEWTGEKILRPKVVELVAERCRSVHSH